MADVQTTLQELGIASHWIERRRLAFLLTPQAAAAWWAMPQQSSAYQITRALVSAFRSVARQREIVLEKLGQGLSIDTVLQSVAPPDFSEHHTGRAIDIGTSEDCALEEVFETTPVYQWLPLRAADFGFYMSYPRDNSYGFVFEPWHWCYHETRVAMRNRNL